MRMKMKKREEKAVGKVNMGKARPQGLGNRYGRQ